MNHATVAFSRGSLHDFSAEFEGAQRVAPSVSEKSAFVGYLSCIASKAMAANADKESKAIRVFARFR